MEIYIYKITNLINNKIYIGQCSNKNRFKRYFGGGKLMRDVVRKYGKENFKKEILFTAKNEYQADLVEKYLINKNNCLDKNVGYNLSSGGKVTHSISEETKDKIRNTIISKGIGKERTGENNPFFGKHHSKKTIKRLKKYGKTLIGDKNPMFGKSVSSEIKNKISESMKLMYRNKYYKNKLINKGI